jgi:hypothetical protein
MFQQDLLPVQPPGEQPAEDQDISQLTPFTIILPVIFNNVH